MLQYCLSLPDAVNEARKLPINGSELHRISRQELTSVYGPLGSLLYITITDSKSSSSSSTDERMARSGFEIQRIDIHANPDEVESYLLNFFARHTTTKREAQSSAWRIEASGYRLFRFSKQELGMLYGRHAEALWLELELMRSITPKDEDAAPQVEENGKLPDGVARTFENVLDYVLSWAEEPVKEKVQ
ncbi:MAG: hypothetical protein Q9226_001479 [Calogaya cf. arnoldii]